MISISGAFFAMASSKMLLQRLFDLRAPVVDVMQVERQLHHQVKAGPGGPAAVPRFGSTEATASMIFAAVCAGSPSASTACIPSSGSGGSGGQLAFQQLLREEMIGPRHQSLLQHFPATMKEDHGRGRPSASSSSR